jgi:hypothetical protein
MKKKRASGSVTVRQSLARRMAARVLDLWKRDPLAVIAGSLFIGAFLVIAYPTNYFETFPFWFEWRTYQGGAQLFIQNSGYPVETLGVGVLLPIVQFDWCSATNGFTNNLCEQLIPFPRIRLNFYEWFGFWDQNRVESQYWGNRLIPAAALLISSGFLLLLRLRPITSRR